MNNESFFYEHTTSEGDYILGKYVYPLGFFIGSLALLIGSTTLYILYREDSALTAVLLTAVVFCCIAYFIIPQFYRIQKVQVAVDGLLVGDKKYPWNSVLEIRQVFVFRIEFVCQLDGKMEIVAMPIPFSLENFVYPLPSKILLELRSLKENAS